MSEDRIEDLIERARQEYHCPPRVPREAIWAAIERRRETERAPKRGPLLRSRWVWWPAAAAAVLALGIVIGRGSGPTRVAPPVAEQQPAPGETSTPDEAFQFAAVRYLGQADALLTEFRTGVAKGDANGRISTWAAELLMETRLLMDSPAAEDEELKKLLGDLELILAQIVQSTGPDRDEERQWIKDGLEKRDVLERLRSRVPAGNLSLGA